LGRAFWTFSAKIFSDTATRNVALGFTQRFFVFMGQVTVELGWAMVLSAVLGLYLLMRRRKILALGLFIFTLLGAVALACLVGGFSPANPDSRGYMLTFMFLVASLASIPVAIGAAAIFKRFGFVIRDRSSEDPTEDSIKEGPYPTRAVPKKKAKTFLLLFLCLPLAKVPLVLNKGLDDIEDHVSWSRYELNEYTFASFPPSAVFLAGYHETIFGVWYGMTVCGKRPDVVAIYRHNANIPGRLRQLKKKWRDVSFMIHQLNNKRASNEALMKTAKFRPVLIEPDSSRSEPLGRSLLSRLRPMGFWFYLDSNGAKLDEEKKNLRAWKEVIEISGEFFHEKGVRRYLLWRSFGALWLLEAQQRCHLAEPAAKIARSIAPKDPMLTPLLKSCGFFSSQP
jgi:NADH:ubiquinone oxidoreductase subunit K